VNSWMTYVPFAIWLLIVVPPSIQLLRRTGIHVALAAFNIFPFIGTVVLIWVVAFSKWPRHHSHIVGLIK
jgi:hypothetical protein